MIDLFLTAYDPSDLPGTSIDPLGFERGYLFLFQEVDPWLPQKAFKLLERPENHPRIWANFLLVACCYQEPPSTRLRLLSHLA